MQIYFTFLLFNINSNETFGLIICIFVKKIVPLHQTIAKQLVTFL